MRHLRWVVALAFATLCGPVGCHSTVVRAHRKGQLDATITAAERVSRPVRGRSARAYADALVQTDRFDDARDTLRADAQRGHIASLAQLADIEMRAQRRASAALHWLRVAELGGPRSMPDELEEICELWGDRVRSCVAHGDGIAAEATLEVAEPYCETLATDRELAASVTSLAKQQVLRRIDHREPEVATEQPLDDALAEARNELERWRLHQRRGVTWPVGDVPALVLAELHGELGRDVLSDEQWQAIVGDLTGSELEEAIADRPAPEQAAVKLRMASVLPDLPVKPGALGVVADDERWSAEAATQYPQAAWRVYLLSQQREAVELELRALYDKPPYRSNAAPSSAADLHGARHWSLTVECGDDKRCVAAMIAVAKLRGIAGQNAIALEGLSLRARHDPEVRDAEIDRAAAWGNPWRALMLLPDDHDKAVRQTLIGALAVERALCGGGCEDDTVGRAERAHQGKGWTDAVEAEVQAWLRAAAQNQEALELWRRPMAANEAGFRVDEAWEADDIWGRDAEWAIPWMIEHVSVLPAERLSELFVLGPPSRAEAEILAAIGVAIVIEDWERAELLSMRLTALTDEPIERWWQIARWIQDRRRIGLKAPQRASLLYRRALHEISLHHPTRRDARADLALLANAVLELADLRDGYDAHRDEDVRRLVNRERATVHPALRWAWERRLAAWVQTFQTAHASGHESILAELSEPELIPERGGLRLWSDRALAHGVVAQRDTVPPMVELFGDPAAFIESRRAIAEYARDWPERRRVALGLMMTGSLEDRAHGMAQLWAMADDEGRTRLAPVLAQFVVARFQTRRVPTVEREALARVILGLDPRVLIMSRWEPDDCRSASMVALGRRCGRRVGSGGGVRRPD